MIALELFYYFIPAVNAMFLPFMFSGVQLELQESSDLIR